MALSPNKGYNLQATGANPNTWGVVANANLSITDLNFGGRFDIDVSGNSNITVTQNQAQNLIHYLTGILTGDIEYILPAIGSTYLIVNATTGSYTITAQCAGGGGGTFIAIQGYASLIVVNPDISAAYGFGQTATSLRVSATDRVIGRQSSGAGYAEEITCTASGRALIAAANSAAQLTAIGAQPLNTSLTNFAANTDIGFSAQISIGSYSGRVLTGTANEIAISNGNGVSGNPVFSLPSALTLTGKTMTGGAFTNIATQKLNTSVGTFNGDTGISMIEGGSGVGSLWNRTGDGDVVRFYRSTLPEGSISVSASGTAYNQSSDSRIKFDQKDFVESGDIIDALRPKSWSGENGKIFIGLIAQEVFRIIPNAVLCGDNDPFKRRGDEGFELWQMSYSNSEIIATMIAELKSLRIRVSCLEKVGHTHGA